VSTDNQTIENQLRELHLWQNHAIFLFYEGRLPPGLVGVGRVVPVKSFITS
jgi:hypothetical protein